MKFKRDVITVPFVFQDFEDNAKLKQAKLTIDVPALARARHDFYQNSKYQVLRDADFDGNIPQIFENNWSEALLSHNWQYFESSIYDVETLVNLQEIEIGEKFCRFYICGESNAKRAVTPLNPFVESVVAALYLSIKDDENDQNLDANSSQSKQQISPSSPDVFRFDDTEFTEHFGDPLREKIGLNKLAKSSNLVLPDFINSYFVSFTGDYAYSVFDATTHQPFMASYLINMLSSFAPRTKEERIFKQQLVESLRFDLNEVKDAEPLMENLQNKIKQTFSPIPMAKHNTQPLILTKKKAMREYYKAKENAARKLNRDNFGRKLLINTCASTDIAYLCTLQHALEQNNTSNSGTTAEKVSVISGLEICQNSFRTAVSDQQEKQ